MSDGFLPALPLCPADRRMAVRFRVGWRARGEQLIDRVEALVDRRRA
jgi:hypothetical protein